MVVLVATNSSRRRSPRLVFLVLSLGPNTLRSRASCVITLTILRLRRWRHGAGMGASTPNNPRQRISPPSTYTGPISAYRVMLVEAKKGGDSQPYPIRQLQSCRSPANVPNPRGVIVVTRKNMLCSGKDQVQAVHFGYVTVQPMKSHPHLPLQPKFPSRVFLFVKKYLPFCHWTADFLVNGGTLGQIEGRGRLHVLDGAC